MRYGICSYSLRRTFERGDMDIFSYVTWCKEVGFTQLDPWMRHLEAGFHDDLYLEKIKSAADVAGIPFGCIAVDGAHIYEPTVEGRIANRKIAYRWLDVANILDAEQVRIDAGGREETQDEIFDIVVEGYNDLLAYAENKGVELIIENHWGPFKDPDALKRLLTTVSGLGLLFDSANWPDGTHERAWKMHAGFARCAHFKTFEFDADGNEKSWDIPGVIDILRQANYDGCWSIESVPPDGEAEIETALKTLALLKRELEG